MSIRNLIANLLRRDKSKLISIIEKFSRKYSSELFLSVFTLEGLPVYSLSSNDAREMELVSDIKNFINGNIKVDAFNGRCIFEFPIRDDVCVGIDYGLLVIVRKKNKVDFERVKRVINELLDNLGERIL